MGKFSPPFSTAQQKVLAILPKCTSIPSIIGSLYIVYDVTKRKDHQKRVYGRILVLMSIMDLLYGVKTFASTWIIPEEALSVWGAKGSVETCTAWGFIGHGSSLSSALYNGSLSAYFLLTITFSWRQRHFTKWVEVLLHAIPLSVGWGTAFVGIGLGLFNPIGWTCWIGTYPPGCGENFPCQRGDYERQDLYRWVFFHAQLWFVFCLSAVAMVLMYLSVRKKEKVMERYNFSDSSSEAILRRRDARRQSLSRKVAIQACLYIFFFFLAWIFPMVQFVVAQKTRHLYFPLLCLTSFFNPLQGFFDLCIYLRPRYLSFREQSRESGIRYTCRQAVINTFSAKNDRVGAETYDPDEDPALRQNLAENLSSPSVTDTGQPSSGAESPLKKDVENHRECEAR